MKALVDSFSSKL